VLIAVVCGCLASSGIGFSTNSAQPAWLLTGGLGSVPRAFPRRRRTETPIENIGASYSRYSSDLQDESSIEQQQRKCRERATADGVSLGTELEFADKAVSGTKREREGLNALLDAARERNFNVLYFESLSRLARESVLTMPMLKELVYVHKVRIVSVSEGIDSSQNNWELLANFMAWMHEQFLKSLRSAVLRGQEQVVLNDWSVGDWCFGYGSEPIPGSEKARRGRNPRPRMRVIINAEHARWVKQIFDWFVVEKMTLDRIARELTKLDAPKDHRSSTKGWHHEYVKRVLRNEKYIGVWSWGKATNVRNPLTGDIAQEGRPPEEVAKWLRLRPDLRLIEDEQFLKAQGMLDQLEAKWALTRTNKGRLRGSTVDSAHPRHLLQSLIKCAECGSTFQVSGAHGKYLGCAGYKRGLCECKTRLPRRLAASKLLGAIGKRILANPAWLDAVVEETRKSWTERRKQNPDERVVVEQLIQAVEQKLSRLLDTVEKGQEEPEDLAERLKQRRREKRELEVRLARLDREEVCSDEPPTRDWIEGKLRALGEKLKAGGADAALALRKFVGGAVTVREAAVEGRKRKHLVGTFTLTSVALINAVGAGESKAEAESTKAEEFTVHFRPAPPWVAVADSVKTAFDAGTDCRGIAKAVGCPYSWVAKSLAWWHRRRGLPVPDGRALKSRLEKPSLAEALADEAKKLWDDDMPMQEIAAHLECNRDTATAAIRHWFTTRGLSVPDGRHRRKEVRERREKEM